MDHVFQRIKSLLEEADKKSFSLHFDDLALGWERALNSQAGDLLVKVGVQAAPPPQSHDSGTAPENPSARPTPEILRPDGKTGDSEKKVAPSLEITIYRQSDAVLEGTLCRALIRGTDIFVEVNADHPIVQEALKAKPVNRMALNLMIVGELAQAIVDVNGGCLIKRIFHRDVAAAICDIEYNHHRSRIVARRLIDRVRDWAVAA